jgi:hypothetical protein
MTSPTMSCLTQSHTGQKPHGVCFSCLPFLPSSMSVNASTSLCYGSFSAVCPSCCVTCCCVNTQPGVHPFNPGWAFCHLQLESMMGPVAGNILAHDFWWIFAPISFHDPFEVTDWDTVCVKWPSQLSCQPETRGFRLPHVLCQHLLHLTVVLQPSLGSGELPHGE